MTRLAELPSLVRRLGEVKQAAARANEDAGVLPAPTADAIDAAAGALAAGRFDAQLDADPRAGGGGIAVHQQVNDVIARAAAEALGRPVDPKGAVAASQSTADVLHTAGRLALLDEVDALDAALRQLLDSLRGAAARFDEVPTLARTCLQDALAVPARLLTDGAAEALNRRWLVLDEAADGLSDVVLGATVVGDGSGAPDAYRDAVVPLLQQLVDRSLVNHPHPASALQHGDDLLDVSAAVVGVAVVAAKVAQDLRLLSSGPLGGFGEIVLPKVVEGSAFFAAKNNPVVPEGVIAAAARVEAADAEVRACVRRAELHLAGYDLSASAALLQAIPPLAAALQTLATDAVDGMVLDEERCRALAALAAPVKEAP